MLGKGAKLWATAQAPGGLWDGVSGTVPNLGPASGRSSWKAAPLASRPGQEPNSEVLPLQLLPQPPLPLQESSQPQQTGESRLHELVSSNSGT